MKKSKISTNDIMILILLFFTFAIIGWFWEVFYEIIRGRGLSNRGVLFGPWLPIYGVCGLLIYFIFNKFVKNHSIVFIGSFILCSIIEYFTSWYLETTKGIRWWDYSGKLFNIDGRICLSTSLFFAISGYILLCYGIPELKRIFSKIPNKILIIICISLVSLFSIDIIYSHEHPNLNKGIKITDNDLFIKLKK